MPPKSPPPSVVQRYLAGIKSLMGADSLASLSKAHGVSAKDRLALKKAYMDVPLPGELWELLSVVDGTYHREYRAADAGVHCCRVLLFATDVMPYYLLSARDMIAERNNMDAETIDERYEDFDSLECDERIARDQPMRDWLCFAHCSNNGGTSRLYLDFHPREGTGGTIGQVVRFVHDPDEFTVVADSFAEFLQQGIDDDFESYKEMCDEEDE